MIAGSNLAEGMDLFLLCTVCCAGTGPCEGPIPRSEESYQVVSVCLCARERASVCVCVCVCFVSLRVIRCNDKAINLYWISRKIKTERSEQR